MDRIVIETVLNIFKVEDGSLKVLLFKDKEQWTLPSRLMKDKEALEVCSSNNLEDFVGYSKLYLKQLSVSDILTEYNDSRVVMVSYLCLVDSITEKLKFKIDESLEYEWVSINSVPKLVSVHNEIVLNAIASLKKEVENPEVLNILYPNEFTLPELQKVLENLLGIKLDRRNFRKKLLVKDWIRETGKNSEPGNGRPGKLYVFNKNIKEETFY